MGIRSQIPCRAHQLSTEIDCMKSAKKRCLEDEELQKPDRMSSSHRAIDCVQAVLESDSVSMLHCGIYAGRSASVGA